MVNLVHRLLSFLAESYFASRLAVALLSRPRQVAVRRTAPSVSRLTMPTFARQRRAVLREEGQQEAAGQMGRESRRTALEVAACCSAVVMLLALGRVHGGLGRQASVATMQDGQPRAVRLASTVSTPLDHSVTSEPVSAAVRAPEPSPEASALGSQIETALTEAVGEQPAARPESADVATDQLPVVEEPKPEDAIAPPAVAGQPPLSESTDVASDQSPVVEVPKLQGAVAPPAVAAQPPLPAPKAAKADGIEGDQKAAPLFAVDARGCARLSYNRVMRGYLSSSTVWDGRELRIRPVCVVEEGDGVVSLWHLDLGGNGSAVISQVDGPAGIHTRDRDAQGPEGGRRAQADLDGGQSGPTMAARPPRPAIEQ